MIKSRPLINHFYSAFAKACKKSFILLGWIFLVLLASCSKRKLVQPVYYLDNVLSDIRLKGPVKHLDEITLLAANNKFLKRPYPFSVPVLGEANFFGGGGGGGAFSLKRLWRDFRMDALSRFHTFF
ncbi:hypothetical protein BST97_01030 [Nonlabens spongiae]|uniref:Uncharacterized protein n=1 Tax=Nonlabens spongiae TaxID=331648 RepID=A0A1W6MGU2_9FLAO|nr:hypothetical protein BST97_01030 [Nonlabens spongiae]